MEIAKGPRPIEQGFNGIPVTRDDYLYSIWYTISTFARLDIFVNFLYPNGSHQVLKFTHIPENDDAVNNAQFRLTDGFIISVSCVPSSQCGFGSSCYVTLQLQKGAIEGESPYLTFFSGYLSQFNTLSWPAHIYQSFRSVPGELGCVDDSHTAGDTCSSGYTLPSLVYGQLLSCSFKIVTDGNVGGRQPHVVFDNCMDSFFRVISTDPVDASETNYYFFGVGIGYNLHVHPRHNYCLPYPFPQPPGSTFKICVANVQAGDQLSDIWYYVEEWTAPE